MRKSLLSIAALLFTAGAVPASADVINLQYTTFGGNTATTEGPLTSDMGTAVVNGNSATLTSNNDQVGAVWMDTGLNTHANFVSLNFDINVLSQATSGYGQAFGDAQTPAVQTLGGVRIVQNGIFAESFQLMPDSTDATTGTFAFRNAGNTGVQTIGAYSTNTLYHVQLTADYINNMATASINGGPAVSYALRPGTVTDGLTSEIFVYLNGATGDGVHNSFTIGDTAQTPLPSTASAGILCLGALGLRKVIRRRRATAAVA